MGQTPPPEVDFCGAITKPPLPNGQTAQYYDRFGNAYTDADFPYPGGSSGAYKGMCNSGYFYLVFEGAWSAAEEATICKVFNDLSDMIDNSAIIFPIRILIRKNSLYGGAIGTGSPLWKEDCGMANSRILERLYNDKSPYVGISEYLGTMEIHDAPIWHTISDDLPDEPNLVILPGKFDLYSVALHEALHILGIASRISLTGSPLDGFYSRWDSFIYSLSSDGYLLSPNSDDECCSAHTFNTAVFTNMPNDFAYGCPLQLAFKNNAGTVLAPVNVAGYTDFSGTSGGNIFLNKLSHLDNTCASSVGISGTTNYVMHPGLNEGTIRRTITNAEKQILCALGYHIIEPPVGESCEQPYEMFLKPDMYNIYLYETNTINIPISGTTNSLFFNDVIPDGATMTSTVVIWET